MDNECADFPQFSVPMQRVTATTSRSSSAVQQGYLAESAVDTALIRLFTARIRLGMFDPPSMVPYSRIPQKELDSPAHRQLALHLAEESMVLLKNDGVLPLRPVKRIAVVGPLADQTEVLLGNYNGIPTHTVSLLEGMKAEFPHAKITYVPGTEFLARDPRHPGMPASAQPDPAAVAAARNADVVDCGGRHHQPPRRRGDARRPARIPRAATAPISPCRSPRRTWCRRWPLPASRWSSCS